VRVCERRHPLEVTEPRLEVMVGVPQASVAVAAPGAGMAAGLQPRSLPGGQNVNVGGVASANCTVLVQVLVQGGVPAVNVRV
jgi:hypothetical protein